MLLSFCVQCSRFRDVMQRSSLGRPSNASVLAPISRLTKVCTQVRADTLSYVFSLPWEQNLFRMPKGGLETEAGARRACRSYCWSKLQCVAIVSI
ncbi:hypothetical protein Pla52o_56370 [Novipirellula galeiformis]|uniref:Uncharacterized protein n=1 Tax=Novipirellula galeiformis TaxID=2528004 RepID=A0A5C6BGD1_9BACT|nr:hypothetical protein Pla52o_56370 [Novipirellula galeiformis]